MCWKKLGQVLTELAGDNMAEDNMTEEEIVGLRLYAGPSFSFINRSLRKEDQDPEYSNIIHANCSGMTKLAQVFQRA
jgi:hypothetical protein